MIKPHYHFEVFQAENGWIIHSKHVIPLAPEDIKPVSGPFDVPKDSDVEENNYVFTSIDDMVEGLRGLANKAELPV